MLRRALSIVVCVLVVSGVLLCAPAFGATRVVTLGPAATTSVVDDPQRQQLIIAGDSGFEVRTLDGTHIATVQGLTSVGGIVVTGDTIYVAQCGTSTIATFDALSLVREADVSVGANHVLTRSMDAGNCPIEYLNRRLWFVSGTDRVVSVTDTSPHVVREHFVGQIVRPRLVGPADGQPSNVNVLDHANGGIRLAAYRVDWTTDQVVEVVPPTRIADDADIATAATDMGGHRTLVTFVGTPGVHIWDGDVGAGGWTTDTPMYATETIGDATGTAVSFRSMVGVNTAVGAKLRLEPLIYNAGPSEVIDLCAGNVVVPGGIGSCNDGSRYYVVTRPAGDLSRRELHIIDSPTTWTRSSVVAPRTAAGYAPFVVSGRIQTTTADPLGGWIVDVHAWGSADGIWLGQAISRSDGTWSLVVQPGTIDASGRYRLWATGKLQGSAPAGSYQSVLSEFGEIDVTAAESTVTIAASPQSLTVGSGSVVSGTFSTNTGVDAGGQWLTVQAAGVGANSAVVAVVQIDADGRWSAELPATTFAAAGAWKATASVAANGVQPAASASVTITASDPTATGTLPAGSAPADPAPASPASSEPPPAAPFGPVRDVRTATDGATDAAPARPAARTRIVGTRREDSIFGTKLAEQIRGLRANDILRGGAGNDRIWGDSGNDRIFGQTGNDVLVGGIGRDLLDGGPGRDTCIVGPTDVARSCERIIHARV